ncbi:MAG: hypoxanthine phosphoribosyltransferase [Candidatus Hydrothermales bacterium]
MELILKEKDIKKKVKEIAKLLKKEYKGKNPVIIGILKGGFIFLSDLIREMGIDCTLEFIRLSSYGKKSKITEKDVKIMWDLPVNIENKDVILVEDIVDTGFTLKFLKENLLKRKPRSLKTVVFLDKYERREADVEIDIIGFKVPNKFLVGYGLDYNEKFRYFKNVYGLNHEEIIKYGK